MQYEHCAEQQLLHLYRLAMGTERTMSTDVVTVEHAFVETSEIKFIAHSRAEKFSDFFLITYGTLVGPCVVVMCNW